MRRRAPFGTAGASVPGSEGVGVSAAAPGAAWEPSTLGIRRRGSRGGGGEPGRDCAVAGALAPCAPVRPSPFTVGPIAFRPSANRSRSAPEDDAPCNASRSSRSPPGPEPGPEEPWNEASSSRTPEEEEAVCSVSISSPRAPLPDLAPIA